MASRRALERLLNAYAQRGWRDHDASAIEIVAAIADDEPPERAARLASRDMLSRNGITRADLAQLLHGFLAAELDLVDVRAPDPEVRRTDVVVLTAIPSEFQAVRGRLQGDVLRTTSSHGTVYYVGHVPGSPLTVAVTEVGPGNLGAAAEAMAAITEFEPRLVLFVGVAGGIKDDVQISDVVVATSVHYYEHGKASQTGFQSRPIPLRTGHRLEQLVRDVARDFRSAQVFVKPIAAGEQLVGSADAMVVQTIKDHYNDAVALDMESGGLYEVAHRVDVPCLSIRGISDHLDGKTSEADSVNQPLAVDAAVEFMELLLRDSYLTETI